MPSELRLSLMRRHKSEIVTLFKVFLVCLLNSSFTEVAENVLQEADIEPKRTFSFYMCSFVWIFLYSRTLSALERHLCHVLLSGDQIYLAYLDLFSPFHVKSMHIHYSG